MRRLENTKINKGLLTFFAFVLVSLTDFFRTSVLFKGERERERSGDSSCVDEVEPA